MSLPSIEELQELLRSTTPGPWEVRQHYDDGTPRPDESAQLYAGDDYLGIMHGLDADLTALAKELAEEIIRLREGIEELKGTYKKAAEERFSPEEHDDVEELIQDINLATVYRLDRILEGEK